jgi:hypothetical protein
MFPISGLLFIIIKDSGDDYYARGIKRWKKGLERRCWKLSRKK